MSSTIGSDLERVGARAKVTGATRFGADNARSGLAYAAFVTATIGKGRITRIDTGAASATAGVLLVMTHESMERLQSPGFVFGGGIGFQSFVPMQDERIAYRGQPIAVVVAESLEAAREAAALVKVEFDEEPFSVTLDAPGAETVLQSEAIPIPAFADKSVGDADAAIRAAEVVVEGEYFTPPQHQNPMELLATVAEWQDRGLVVHESTQTAEGLRFGVSQEMSGTGACRVAIRGRCVRAEELARRAHDLCGACGAPPRKAGEDGPLAGTDLLRRRLPAGDVAAREARGGPQRTDGRGDPRDAAADVPSRPVPDAGL